LITFLTFLAAVIPGLLICYFIIRMDLYEKEPLFLLLICLGMGVVIFYCAREIEGVFDSWINHYIQSREAVGEEFNRGKHLGVLLYDAFVRTAFVEEFLKLAVLLLIPFQRKEFNESMDGIVYAVMIGMGFAITENVEYTLSSGDYALALFRDFTAVPAHAVFGIILGFYVGLAKMNKQDLWKNILIGLLLAILIHGLYDFFLFQDYEEWIAILATLVLLGGLFFSRKFIYSHQENSPFKVENIETAQDTPSEYSNPPNTMKIEENEILSAVLFEMNENLKEEE